MASSFPGGTQHGADSESAELEGYGGRQRRRFTSICCSPRVDSRFVPPRQLAQVLVPHSEEDDGEKRGCKRERPTDMPPPEDEAEVFGIPGKQPRMGIREVRMAMTEKERGGRCTWTLNSGAPCCRCGPCSCPWRPSDRKPYRGGDGAPWGGDWYLARAISWARLLSNGAEVGIISVDCCFFYRRNDD